MTASGDRVRLTVMHADELGSEVWDDDSLKGRLGLTTLFSAGLTPTDGLTAGVCDMPPEGWLGRHRHAPAEIWQPASLALWGGGRPAALVVGRKAAAVGILTRRSVAAARGLSTAWRAGRP